MVRVLIAPDKFRGTLSARQAAEALAAGWRRARPGDELDLAPMADGGEGTTEAVTAALGGTLERVRVHGPLGDEVEAVFGVAGAGRGPVAVLECASASGLHLLSERRRDPRRTSSRGTGELIAAALEHRPRQVIVGLGGSATNDGGAGMAQALGVRMLDAEGLDLRPGGAALLALSRIDATGLDPRLRDVVCFAAADVNHPLTGPTGASAVFGPQKGASTQDVALLDAALGHLAVIAARDLGASLRDEPGAGAAGGLGFGLMAFLGARVRSGVEVVAEALDLRRRVEAAALVITGEGRLDAQSLGGKVPAGVLELAREAGVRGIAVCGEVDAGIDLGDVDVVSLVDHYGRGPAIQDAAGSLRRAAEELAVRAQEPSRRSR